MTTSGDSVPKTLHIQPVTSDDDPAQVLAELSPTTQARAVLLLQSLRKNEAVIGQDDKKRPVIQYKDEKSKQLWWDASNANMITKPRTDSDVQQKMDACLELIDYLKEKKPPSGIVLDSSHVKPTLGHYREDKEFTKTKDILGKGNSAGDIIIVKDTATGTESALKTMMISVFRKEEIQAWVDLNETGVPPALYSFQLKGNRVQIFMEKIDNGVTLRDVIDTHMNSIRSADPALAKPFSLYVFHGILSAVNLMHERGWAHRDLHAGNIMLEATSEGVIQTRIIDFGLAKPLQSEDGPRGFRTDVIEVVRKFTALYLDQEFDSESDVRKNWNEKLSEMADLHALSKDDRTELFCLIDSALQVVSRSDVPKFQQELASKLNFDTQSLSRRVAKILFPKHDLKQTAHLKDPIIDSELEKISQGYSKMDMADGGLGDTEEEYFTAEEFDDSFLESLRKQAGVGW